MKRSIVSVMSLSLLFLFGCSQLNPNPGTPPDLDTLAPQIQSRVRYIAMFAFSMDQIKPHVGEVCEVTNAVIDFLNSYDDQEASFAAIRSGVMELVNQIEDSALRSAVMMYVDMVLTESFNYAWKHYSDWINQDEVQVTLVLARAIATGLQEACNAVSSVSVMSINDDISSMMTVPAYRYHGHHHRGWRGP